jgi:hypothetical protein
MIFSSERNNSVQKDIEFGLANIEVVAIDGNEKSTLTPGIVVRIKGQQNRIQSFGMSNEGGIIVMPLPPGRYCYDAFTDKGKALRMVRAPSDRCFSLKKDSVETIGVEFQSIK